MTKSWRMSRSRARRRHRILFGPAVALPKLSPITYGPACHLLRNKHQQHCSALSSSHIRWDSFKRATLCGQDGQDRRVGIHIKDRSRDVRWFGDSDIEFLNARRLLARRCSRITLLSRDRLDMLLFPGHICGKRVCVGERLLNARDNSGCRRDSKPIGCNRGSILSSAAAHE
jgi:hypothetical protein